MIFISFHANITYQSVQFVERLLASQIGMEDAGATIMLCTGGGDSAAGVGLFYFIKSLPYKVHVHAAGMCASGGVSLLLAGDKRTCSLGTYSMLHGSKAPDGTLSPQYLITRSIFENNTEWDEKKLDVYFSDVKEKWFSAKEAIKDGLIHKIDEFSFPKNATIHVVPN